ncbi:MAG: hypothetical protein LBR18_07915 [Tannerella sp.]|jgi:hypothetical protein|nr:hypothetical protein [Tannerella sp.]
MKHIGKLLIISFLAIIFSCSDKPQVKVYGWTGEGRNSTLESLTEHFKELKQKGLVGVCHGVGADIERIERAAKAAHAAGLEFHAWHATMVQHHVDSSWYAVNRNGESAFKVQAYVPHYRFMCPGREEVFDYLADLYGKMADIPELDYVHLDYIRFPDVILPRGLWDKYGLVMNEEYPVADYCYCDRCVSQFKEKTGIDIRSYADPSTCEEWKQFRYDQITSLVNRLVDVVHSKGKKISAAVFPGPSLSKKLVRQEWNKWNVDVFFPMNYNDFYLEGADWLQVITKEETDAIAGRAPVYSGLFICRDWQNKASIKDPEGHGLLPSEIEEAVRGSMESGAAGVCLFTPGSMTDDHWKALEKAIRRKY